MPETDPTPMERIARINHETLTAFWFGWLTGALAYELQENPPGAEELARKHVEQVRQAALDGPIHPDDEAMATAAREFLEQVDLEREQDAAMERALHEILEQLSQD